VTGSRGLGSAEAKALRLVSRRRGDGVAWPGQRGSEGSAPGPARRRARVVPLLGHPALCSLVAAAAAGRRERRRRWRQPGPEEVAAANPREGRRAVGPRERGRRLALEGSGSEKKMDGSDYHVGQG
jgi:hypothetical protein